VIPYSWLMMLRNQLKHGRFRVIGKLGAAPGRPKPAKAFSNSKLKASKRVSRLLTNLSSDWPCRWIKIELNPRKLKLVYVSVLHSWLSRRTKREPGEGKERNKARVEPARLQACNNDARPGPSPAPKHFPTPIQSCSLLAVRDSAWYNIYIQGYV
jgi:hypothetical protein